MSEPGKPLRILLVEDSENDAMLLLRELRRGGYEPCCRRVDTPEDLEAALRDADDRGEPWEIIVSDYYMPRFRGTDALSIVRKLGYDTPFIVVSGKVGEDLAVEIMKAGAQDYITKENMVRLNPAIERELGEARIRRDRQQTREALDRSEERFRRLVEQAADAMFVHDLEGRLVDVNRQACESLGYTREELLGLSVPDVEMKYEAGALEKLWREVSSGAPRTLEGMHRRKDGTTFPVEIRLGVFESEGTPLMLATVRDITERRRAEEAVRESEKRFRALVQNASDIIIVLDPDGTIRYESPALERILGYKPEERIGRRISELIHPDDLEHVAEAFAYYIRDPRTHRTVEYRVRARDGTWHHFEGIGNNLVDDPSVRGIVVNARDVTDRKRAEREVRDSEEKYRTLFETMTQGIVYQDAEGRITSANPAAERILGLSLEQMRGKLFPDPRRRTIRENGSELPVEEHPTMVALRTGEKVAEVIGVYVPERDEYCWLNVNAVPQFRPGEDSPYQAYAIFDDITARRQAEGELQQSEHSLAEAQRIAHIGNWHYDVARDRAYWSDELYRIFGLAPQQFVPTYKTFLDFVHPEDRSVVRGAVRGAWLRVDRSSIEYRIVRPDGETRFVSTRYECARNVSGRPVRLVGTIQDITWRMRAEEALKVSETRFRTIIEQSPLSVQILSPDGRTLQVNRAWEELWGATAEDIGDYNLLEDQQLVDKGIMPYIQRGFAGEPARIPPIAYDPDESLPHVSGHEESERWVQAFIYPVKDEAGNIREVTLIHEDVTERKRAEQAVLEGEKRYRAVVEQATEGILLVDVDSKRVLEANAAYHDLLGYAPEEILELTLYDLVPYSRHDMDCYVQRVLEQSSYVSGERRHRRKDGSLVDVEVSANMISYGGREVMCVLVRDITERKQSAAELERQAELINLSHDAIIVRDLDGAISYWNRGAEEVYGWSRDEAVGINVHELLRTRSPSSQEDVDAMLQLGGRWEGELRHVRRGGEAIVVESRQVIVGEAGSRKILEINRDITERKRNERELARLATFPELNPAPIIETDAAGNTTYLNPAADAWFQELADYGGDHPMLADLERVEAEIRGSGGRPLNREVRVGENFYLQTVSLLPESGLLRIYATDITERRRAEDGLRFLAGASEALASSLDYHETLASVARLAVPDLADWCVVDVFEGGSLKRLAVVHEDPEKLDLARKLQERYPPDPEARYGVSQALREGTPILVPEVTEALLQEAARDEEHLEVLMGLGLKSYMAVPLTVRGRTLGVITLASDESGPVYGEADLELAEDLARRAAVAVDNARLYEEAQKEISEREEAEAALRTSRERYRTFIAQSTEGIMRFELEEPIPLDGPEDEQIEHFYRYGYLAECNDAMARMYGFASAEEIIGTRVEDMLPRSVPENVEFLRAGIRNGYRVVDAESMEFDRWGNRKYFLNNLTGIIEDGRVVRAWGTQRDITEQRQAEEALRQSEELYRTVVEQAAENIFLVDVETRCILEANDAFCNSLGYGEEEIERLTLYDVIAHDRESVDRNIQRILSERRHFVGERKYRRRDGSLVDVEVSVSLVSLEGREAMCVVAHDITGRKRVEEALRRSEELYRAVVEQAGEGIFLFDAETKQILETNTAFQRMLGYTPEELGRMKLYEVISDAPEGVDENVRRTLEKGRLLVGERSYRRKDGSVVDVEVGGSVISYRGREVLCAVARDVTERKQAEEARREVREAERNRIARDLHDDILQDIVYALQEASILHAVSEDGGAPELEEIADALRRSVEGLREVIYELRLEETLKQSFDISLRSLVELNRRMSRKRYALDLEVEGEFPDYITYSAGREIIRILQEALNNARRHANPRHVRVRLEAGEDEIWAEVEDDGRGFDPETIMVGVGQHSMRHRAAKLGGELRVESEAGAGTRVSLRVPYDRLVE